MFEKPVGMRDLLPAFYQYKESVREKMVREIRQWGFQFVQTPTLEYFETVGKQSAIAKEKMFKVLNQNGDTLVIRPDLTAPIARIVASFSNQFILPVRLAYSGNVFRTQQREGGEACEFEQIGVEIIGEASVFVDAESISLLIETLKKATKSKTKVIVSHVGFLDSLVEENVQDLSDQKEHKRLLYSKNEVGFKHYIEGLLLSPFNKRNLLTLLSLRGGEEKLDEALQVITSAKGKESVYQLQQLWKQLVDFEVEDLIAFDLKMMNHMDYYTGIFFEAYIEEVRSPIANGGRYDELYKQFNKDFPATGFAIHFDRLTDHIKELEEPKKPLSILFSDAKQKDAIELAKQYRKQGVDVVLQHIKSVQDLPIYRQQFEDCLILRDE
ncbi:ATP phosphoribosyltransferase regulatory subunit [Bacillus carboniphilus]|uniref:ATP phosphoribosyltransferase regulatory subunit n=1 Tax=Bacillus carboniphilus TaxID=86663 RepID=A0ABY9K3F0_9BACI|nr:ATP phosphoribosyltransferase regulatory subunit [Bacillus carboniphilus]WLR44315.1 ATP phosphoribosyltransferase regulatory subunit [Bacillus carboniphilus]